jgi:hypothetical protein
MLKKEKQNALAAAREPILRIDTAASEKEFVIDRKTYRLRYGFDAIAGVEEGTGINPALGSYEPTFFNLMCLLWAGLRAHHPEVTIDTVKTWFVDQDSALALSKLAWESFFGAVPKSAAKEEIPNPPSA